MSDVKRNFPNWLEAWTEYADNKFAPRVFHQWAGISTISGALGRKVWLPWDTTFSYFPNMFIFLIAHPGVGKSSALIKSTNLLRDLNKHHGGKINFVPSQVTEAKFIDLMSQSESYSVGNPPKIFYQNAGYYFASEASNSFKNIWGDFIACVTDFYDCPQSWEKATKKDGRTHLNNVCFNLIAGSTFDYLGKIITNDNIMGGFASRVTYVIFKEKLTDEQIDQKAVFQGKQEQESAEAREQRKLLLEDLRQIHTMVGPYSGTAEFGKLYSKWYPKYERERQEHPSEKMQSLLVRKPTSLFKLSMILSAAESNSRVLEAHHWTKALQMVEEVEQHLPGMLRESKAHLVETQDGMVQSILGLFSARNDQIERAQVFKKLMLKGFDAKQLDATLNGMLSSYIITAEGGGIIRLNVNPNDHL